MKKQLLKMLTSILVLLSILSLTGCGPSADSTVKTFFESLQKGDMTAADKCFNPGTSESKTFKFDNKEEEKITKLIFSKIKYEIVSTKENDKDAVVKTKVTAPDLMTITGKMVSELLPKIYQDALSGKESDTDKMTEQYFINSLSASDVTTVTTEVDIKLVKTKDGWLMQSDDNLLNAISGNLFKAFDSLSKSLNGQN